MAGFDRAKGDIVSTMILFADTYCVFIWQYTCISPASWVECAAEGGKAVRSACIKACARMHHVFCWLVCCFDQMNLIATVLCGLFFSCACVCQPPASSLMSMWGTQVRVSALVEWYASETRAGAG